MFKGAAVNRLVGLDGLRGMAALMVFLFHLAVIFELDIPELPFYLGVDLFFALSGFVMARSYEARLRTELPALRFIIIRYRRLWLPLAVGSVIGCALVYFTEGLDFAALLAFVAILFFMPAPWMPQGSFIFNLPAWSLFVEIVCNALHAAFFVWASNLLLAIMLAVSAVVLIATTAFDLTGGILATGALAALGFVVLPAQRRRAVREFSARVDTLRSELRGGLERELTDEVDQAIGKVRALVLPVARLALDARASLDERAAEADRLSVEADALRSAVRSDFGVGNVEG